MSYKSTIKDVAKAAGVSYPTVSYVFNNSRPVSEKTRELVLRTARDLGYVPDVMARGLATTRSFTIGLIYTNFHYGTSIPIIAAIEEASRVYNYRQLLVLQSGDPAAVLRDLQDLTARRMDAIIFVSATDDLDPVIVAELNSTRIPVLLAYSSPLSLDTVDSVLPDQVQGGILATRHLIRRERRRLAFIGSRETNNATRKRASGFTLAHKQMRLDLDPDLIVYCDDYKADLGREAMLNLLDKHQVDGVFAADDNLAVGAVQACQLKGLKVPDDVAVIGFHNSVLCNVTLPKLTSVAMPFERMGQVCLERIIHRLENPNEWTPGQTLLPCKIVERGTA